MNTNTFHYDSNTQVIDIDLEIRRFAEDSGYEEESFNEDKKIRVNAPWTKQGWYEREVGSGSGSASSGGGGGGKPRSKRARRAALAAGLVGAAAVGGAAVANRGRIAGAIGEAQNRAIEAKEAVANNPKVQEATKKVAAAGAAANSATQTGINKVKSGAATSRQAALAKAKQLQAQIKEGLENTKKGIEKAKSEMEQRKLNREERRDPAKRKEREERERKAGERSKLRTGESVGNDEKVQSKTSELGIKQKPSSGTSNKRKVRRRV